MPVNAHEIKSLYEHAAVRALFDREIASLSPILSGIYGNHGLFLRGHDSAPSELPRHLLGAITTMSLAQSDGLDGDVRCRACALPFNKDSFNLLIAQHAYEGIDRLEVCIEEIARVTAAEGVLLILGFNPLSAWRPWLKWQSRISHESLTPRSAQEWRRHLLRERIDTLQVRFLGTLLPQTARSSKPTLDRGQALSRLRGSWLLLARKRRATLTPLRLRSRNAEFGLRPGLVPGAQRIRA